MTVSEKSAYIKGLAEGLKLNKETAEGKLISELIELVDDLAQTVESIDSELVELEDFVGDMDADLSDVEDIIEEDDEFDFDDDDDDWDFDDEDEFDCDGNCEGCDGCDDVFDVEEEGMRCIMCDSCGDTICFDETLDPETIVCPSCGKHIVGGDEDNSEE